jgi:uncharacterized membrane protein
LARNTSHEEGQDWRRYVFILVLIGAVLALARRLSSLDVREVTLGQVIGVLAVASALGLMYWLIVWRSRDKPD